MQWKQKLWLKWLDFIAVLRMGILFMYLVCSMLDYHPTTRPIFELDSSQISQILSRLIWQQWMLNKNNYSILGRSEKIFDNIYKIFSSAYIFNFSWAKNSHMIRDHKSGHCCSDNGTQRETKHLYASNNASMIGCNVNYDDSVEQNEKKN